MAPTHVALLRAINVGGFTLPMARLRAIAVDLGWTDVSTHLASGNLLLSASESAVEIAARLAASIRAEFDRDVRVVVRTPAELADALERVQHVFPAAVPGRVHLAFLDQDPGADADSRLGDFAPDEHLHLGRELALHYPTGQATTKMTTAVIERRLDVVATVRGLRTVEGILARADAPPTTGR